MSDMQTSVRIKNRTFSIPRMPAVDQKDIYFKIHPIIQGIAVHNAAVLGQEFNDAALLQLFTIQEFQCHRQWLEDLLMKNVKEQGAGGKLEYVDVESFSNTIHDEYVPLLIEILKINCKDFFFSLTKDAKKLAEESKIQQGKNLS